MRYTIILILLLITALFVILAIPSHADEPAPYSARDTLQRARVGTASPRLAPTVRVETPAGPMLSPSVPSRYDRMECRPDYAQPRVIVCEAKRSYSYGRD